MSASSRFALVACPVALALAQLCPAPAARAGTPLTTVRVAFGLARPVFVTSPPGDTGSVYIVEQRGGDERGRIKILRNGSILPTPFLTTAPLATGNEQGLLGLAFAPDYETSGHFYIHYTPTSGNIVIARHKRSLANPDRADSIGRVLRSIPKPATNHNAGWLGFGPDGYLYTTAGDGGGGGDPGDRAQNLNELLGKILRLDVSGDSSAVAPPDNPFFGPTTGLDDIWSFGLRNPYRCSFDRETGDLIIGDVGQFIWEEVDFAPASQGGGRATNFGWRCFEGDHPFDDSSNTPCDSCTNKACVFPFDSTAYEYNQTVGSRCAVTGGYVYRGFAIPDLLGTYFFADFCSGEIVSGTFDGTKLIDVTDRTAELAPGGGLSITSISSFGEDAQGELYICDLGGEVFRIEPRRTGGVEPGPGGVTPRVEVLGAMPFRSDLELAITVAQPGRVSLGVYDAKGRRLRQLLAGPVEAGRTVWSWDGRDDAGADVRPGVYFVRLETGAGEAVTRAIRLP